MHPTFPNTSVLRPHSQAGHGAADGSPGLAPPFARTGPWPGLYSFLGMPALIACDRTRALLDYLRRVGSTDAAVLITGESGSGKEWIARALHVFSPRASNAWIDINCAALPDHLVESELFGYEKGAFSGAETPKPGLFELASGGTLFLDEIGELPLASQSKLLRVLDGFPHYRLGGTRKIEIDVRIVAATNTDLEAAVAARRFREDLFHRLDQVRVLAPPLRERPSEVGPLARFFLAQTSPEIGISPCAIEALEHCPWPGNVRELRNLIRRVALFAPGPSICVEDLPPEYRNSLAPAPDAPSHSLDRLEEEVILNALEQTQGRRARAAELLGISRRTLIRRLNSYGVNRAAVHAAPRAESKPL